ncbi:hypothetical protein IQ231_21345 [Cuspidothrix issatschenkoi LEGE 03284]|nr:hypothetical protein [Cuspidothrix issatschenkoi]MBE9234139.1 hypothetical protein [Cuspidothrix issatschenkoi LEGE 03284]
MIIPVKRKYWDNDRRSPSLPKVSLLVCVEMVRYFTITKATREILK